MVRRCLFLLWVFGLWFFDVKGLVFHFETLSTKNGLSSNDITCLYEDRHHFLWVGTRDGLNRFDGRKFLVFRNNPEDTNSISGNGIVAILQDAQGIYWFATKDGGLTRYDENAPPDRQFRQFKTNPRDSTSIITNRLNCLYDWDENYLLVGSETSAGIFVNKKTFALSYWNPEDSELHPRAATTQLVKNSWSHHMVHHEGKLYISLLLNGLMYTVDIQTGRMQKLSPAKPVTTTQHFFVANSQIWMAGWAPGLHKQRDEPLAEQQTIPGISDLLNCVTDFNKDYLLAGSRSTGLYCVNKHTLEITTYRKDVVRSGTLPSNKINCLLRDSRGIAWIGTGAGLAKYDPKAWLFDEAEFTDAQTDVSILHTHRFVDGSVAVNSSQGMFLSNEKQQGFRHIVFNHRGRTINPDFLLPLTNSEFLMGTESGFYYWEKGSTQLRELKVQFHGKYNFYNITVYQVRDILSDTVEGEPGYWLSVLGYGVAFYNTTSHVLHEFIGGKGSLASSMTRKIAIDAKGNLWVATSGGLCMRAKNTPLDQNIFVTYRNEPGNKNSLPGNEVTGLWLDENSTPWMSIGGRGLCHFDGKNFRQYLPENTFSSKSFFGIHADSRNRLWVITRNGLEVFDRKQQRFYHVDVNDGSSNTFLATQFSNEQSGMLSFSAGNKVFSFRPNAMEFDTAFPSLYLCDMNVFGKNYLQQARQKEVNLKSSERFVNFTVSALQFSAPQTVRFQYRLEGLDEETWNNSADGEVKYTNLPWGHFKLLVRVTNPAGQWGGECVLAQFHIATPFYYTIWFISICVLAVVAIVYGIYRYRIAQLMKLQAIRNKIARDLHDDLGSTLGSISFLSEAANQQLQQQNHAGTQRLLGKIGDNSREMIENMSDIVWSVNPKNDSAKHLAERMRVFASDLLAGGQWQLHFECEPKVDELKLTMEQRKNLFLIFKETIYNSAKYSEAQQLTVMLKRKDKKLQLIIQDNGKGFDVNNYTSKNGNGIRSMRLRAEEIGAKYAITSSPAGTETKVEVSGG